MTRLTDRFDFAAPFGPFGRIAERFWLDREMCDLMIHLQDTAKRLIEAKIQIQESQEKPFPTTK